MVKTNSNLKEITEISLGWLHSWEAIEESFSLDHGPYCQWISDNLKLRLNENRRVIEDLEFEWLTLHYRTLHRSDKSGSEEWTQVGIPFKENVIGYKYTNVYRGNIPPYLGFFREHNGRTKVQKPVQIILEEKGVTPKRRQSLEELTLPFELCESLKTITKGAVAQGDLTSKELVEMPEVDSFIVKRLCQWSGRELNNGSALGLIRDICRVTLLALKEKARYPRTVVLAPINVSGNLIGGFAFVGEGKRKKDMLMAVAVMANHLLFSLRLKEEPLVTQVYHKKIDFSQTRLRLAYRVSHRIQFSVEKISSIIRSTSNKMPDPIKDQKVWAIIQAEINLLNNAATRLRYIGSNNPEDLSDGVPIQIRLNKTLHDLKFHYSDHLLDLGLTLTLSHVPEDWTVLFPSGDFWDVIENLLNNASRFATSKIEVNVQRLDKYLQITVQDDGPGVSASIQPNLFKSGACESNRNIEGDHGHGLYLSKDMLVRRGGDLTYQRASIGGAAFVVTLPSAD